MNSNIELLHAAWCESAAQELNQRATERIFYDAAQYGFTPDDIRVAVKFMVRFNGRSDGAKFRLNVYKVLGDLENFAALVAEARAAMRNVRHPKSEKEKTQQAYEQVVEPEASDTRGKGTGRHISEVFTAMRDAAGQPPSAN